MPQKAAFSSLFRLPHTECNALSSVVSVRSLMRTADLNQIDAQHGPLGVNHDGMLEPITDINTFYDEIDRNIFGIEEQDDVVEFGDMSRAFGQVIQWACRGKTLTSVGARIAALGALLYGSEMPYGRTNLSGIAKEAGCTKQALSKLLIEFKDEIGLTLSIGKNQSARAKYALAQHKAVLKGTHASMRRKQATAIKEANAACKAMLHAGEVVSSAQ